MERAHDHGRAPPLATVWIGASNMPASWSHQILPAPPYANQVTDFTAPTPLVMATLLTSESLQQKKVY